MYKICNSCDRAFPQDEFPKKSEGKTHPKCKECYTKYNREYYHRNPSQRFSARKSNKKSRVKISLLIQESKNKPCADCGNSFPYYVMDFDHLKEKEFTISAKAHNYGRKKLQEEIDKCDVVCSNCHRVRTWERRNAKSDVFEDLELIQGE